MKRVKKEEEDLTENKKPFPKHPPFFHGKMANSCGDLKADLEIIRKKKHNKKTLQFIGEIVFVIALGALVVTLFIQIGDIKAISATFHEIANGNNWTWLLVAFALIVIYLFVWPFSLNCFTKALRIPCSFRDVYEIGDSEHFYNGITPFAAGGQPFQIYFLTQLGAPTSSATGAVLATFLSHLIVSNIFAIVALFFFPTFASGISLKNIKGLEWMSLNTFTIIVIIGYAMNILTLIITFLIGANNGVKKLIVGLMSWLAHLRLFRKLLLKQIPQFEKYCDQTQLAFSELIHHPKAFAIACFYRAIADLAYYSIPFFLLLSIGVDFSANPIGSYWLVVLGTSFAITSVVWVPTPGTSGGVEYAFAIVIASLSFGQHSGAAFPSGDSFDSAKVVSLLWRMITYYFVLIASFLISFSLEIRSAKRERKEIKALDYEATRLSGKIVGSKESKALDPVSDSAGEKSSHKSNDS